MRRRSDILLLLGLVGLFALAFMIIYPLNSTRLGRQGFHLGLDLKGGTYLVYEADLSQKDPDQSPDDAMEGVKGKIERRVNAYGVTEPVIQRQGGNRILVQLPGVRNIAEAKQLIGQTAQLDFREIEGEGENAQWVLAHGTIDGEEKTLTGKYFKPNARVVLSNMDEPEVSFEFNSEGAKIFRQVTERHIGEPLGIFLDNRLISAPTVRSVIESKGVITGLKLDEARSLAIQLNSGALDVPLAVVQQQDVDPTLGADSLQKSIVAGALGVGLIFFFMVMYYRFLGAVGCVALAMYGALVLAIFKMVPVTLTLAGIGGFILSLGMAVDANVLIFERMKEELQGGRTLGAGIEVGFARAWNAIRDSNITTFIACAVLYWFGSRFGAPQVMGFAATLFIGVAVSMFTAILVTRTLLRFLMLRTPLSKRLWPFKVV